MSAAGDTIGQRRIGPFRLGRKLGAGGMATVFAAFEDRSHVKRLVALKVLPPLLDKGDPEHKMFLKEASLATRLEHPNIVRTYDVGEQDGSMYLAMELVHGVSLRDLANAQAGPVPLPIAARIVSDTARALHAAHELVDSKAGHLGVVHQDVSPQNVLVGYDGVVKLVDFGVARLASLEGSRTETVQGKPSYVSPEQVNGKNIDRRTDVFALGIVFWELLTNERLFKRDTSAAAYLAVLNDSIADVRTKNPKVPSTVAMVVAQALHRDRDKRHPTAEKLRLALEGALAAGGGKLASAEEVSAWATRLVPPTTSPNQLEREIVDGTPLPVSGTKPVAAPRAPTDDVPDLVLPTPSRNMTSKAPVAPPPRISSPQITAPPPGNHKEIALTPSSDDDDDFDMQIEREGAAIMPMSQPMTTPRATPRSSSLDLGAPLRTSGRPQRGAVEEAALGAKVVGYLVAFAVFAGVAGVLVKIAHRAGGRPVTGLLPRAFDGSSTVHSGAVSLGALVLAIAVGYVGVRSRPRSIGFLASAAALLVTSLAMVTVTLVTTEENPAPADGLLLLPYVVPAAIVFFGVGLAERAGTLFSQSSARKAGAVPLAAIAGLLAFVAYETSFLVLTQ